MRIHILLVAAAALSGCASYYSAGPAWAEPAPHPGGALVVVYRPKKAFGALNSIHAIYKTRDCELMAGAFCTFYLPPGEQALLVSIPVWAEAMVVGATSWSSIRANEQATRVDLRAGAGSVLYIRAEFNGVGRPPSATLVEGAGELAGLHMAPGGRARDPVAELPDP